MRIQCFYKTIPVPVARVASAQFYTTCGGADSLALAGVFPLATNNQHSIRNFLYVLNFHNILAKKSNQFKIFIILQKKAINFKFSLYSCRKKQSNTISAPKILSGEFHGIYDRNISITLWKMKEIYIVTGYHSH